MTKEYFCSHGRPILACFEVHEMWPEDLLKNCPVCNEPCKFFESVPQKRTIWSYFKDLLKKFH